MSLERIRTHDTAVLAETNSILLIQPTHLISGSMKWPEPSHENAKEGEATDCSQQHGLFSHDQQAVSAENAHRQTQGSGKIEFPWNSHNLLHERLSQFDASWTIATIDIKFMADEISALARHILSALKHVG
jgi:hypothetical protein